MDSNDVLDGPFGSEFLRLRSIASSKCRMGFVAAGLISVSLNSCDISRLFRHLAESGGVLICRAQSRDSVFREKVAGIQRLW